MSTARQWLSGLAALAILGGTGWALYRAADPGRMPVAAIQLEGTPVRVSARTVAEVVAVPAGAGFFRVDLGRVREGLTALPWVKEARVWRVWPDRLRVSIRERVAAARWAAGGLVDTDGELFHPPEAEYPPELPELDGPEGSEAVLLGRHGELREWLSASGLAIRRLAMDERRAWRVETDRDVTLVLGRNPDEALVRRVGRVLPVLLARGGETLARLDLRYPNGFAASWRRPPQAEGKEQHG